MADDLAKLWDQAKPAKDDPASLWEQAKPVDGGVLGKLDAARRGATQGATLGFGEEASSAIAAPILKLIGKFSNNPAYQNAFADKPLGDIYRDTRDSERAANTTAQQAHPELYTGGELGGAVLSSFAPGLSALNVGKGAKLGQAVAKGAALGGLTGLGSSEADLTRGDVGGAARDTAIGATLGGGVGGLAHGVASGFGKIGEMLGGKAQKTQEILDAQAVARGKAPAEKLGQDLGRAGSNASRQAELTDIAGTVLSPEEAADKEWIQSKIGDKAKGRLGEARRAYEELERQAEQARAAQPQLIADEMAKAGGLDEAKRALTSRLKRYAMTSAMGAGAGYVLGGDAKSAGFGALTGPTYRGVLTSVRNLARNPAVQRTAFTAAESLLSGAGRISSSAAPTVEREAAAAGQGFVRAFPGIAEKLGLQQNSLADNDQDQ